MSSFIGAQGTIVFGGLMADDRRAMGQDYQQDVDPSFMAIGGLAEGDFSSPWWPASAFNDDGATLSGSMLDGDSWGYPEEYGGTTSNYGIVGVTRDNFGSPLGGVTVKLFKSTTTAFGLADTLVSSVVSDPVGNFTVTTPFYPDPHYLVTYKAGTPDVFATSPNTLIAG